MASKPIPKKPTLIRNSIGQQRNNSANSLTVADWNRVVNILKEQANNNTKYLEQLHKLLFYDYDANTSGFIEGSNLFENGFFADVLTDFKTIKEEVEAIDKDIQTVVANTNVVKGDYLMRTGNFVNGYVEVTKAHGINNGGFDANPDLLIGVAFEDMTPSMPFKVKTEGLFQGIDTSHLTENAVVYPDPLVPGAFLSTPNQLYYYGTVGVCLKSDPTDGIIYIQRPRTDYGEKIPVQVSAPSEGYQGQFWWKIETVENPLEETEPHDDTDVGTELPQNGLQGDQFIVIE